MPVVLPPSSSLPPSTLTYTHAYSSILRRSRSLSSHSTSASKVVIFAAVDVDALLASKILINLFKQDDVPHTLIPITGYDELQRRKDQLFGTGEEDDEEDEDGEGRDGEERQGKKDDVQTLILLSLGSLLPLSSYFPVESSSCHIHLIDSHRPYNLDNLFGAGVNDGLASGLERRRNETSRRAAGDEGDVVDPNLVGRIWVWSDGLGEKMMSGVKASYEALEYEPPSESESEDGDDYDDENEDEGDDEDGGDEEDEEKEEGDEEDGEGNGGKRRKRERVRRNGNAHGDENGDHNGRGKTKRRRGEDRPERAGRLSRATRQAHTARVQKYYQAGTSYGLSVAESCYLLASEMERGDNDLLWCAILSLTHQYVTSRIDRDEYEDRHTNYVDEVARLNPSNTSRTNGSSPNSSPDDNSISPSEELRFVLLRHWNLYDAMLHSGYVAGRIGIWRDRGRKRLVGLLAKMGFSLAQCQQLYAHMDIDLKNTLRDKLDSIAPEYGLVEPTYPSFVRAFGYRISALSAADAVEGIEALLQAATGVKIEVELDGSRGGGEWFGGAHTWSLPASGGRSYDRDGKQMTKSAIGDSQAVDGQDDLKANNLLEQRMNEKNFWVAYDAMQDIGLLRKSLPLARALHSAIIRQGCSIIDKNGIKKLRAFRFVAIKEGPDLRLFSHAAALGRLAKWLSDATRDKIGREAKAKNKAPLHPMVVASLNEEKGTYTVVGITGAPEFDDIRKNTFGLAFQTAAEDSGAGSRHDMFDTSVVEISKDDLGPFIEALQLRSS